MRRVVLGSVADLTLENAARVAFDGAGVEFSQEATLRIAAGRKRFEQYLDRRGGYVYGSTTAPGARATALLSQAQAERQATTLRQFHPVRAGVSGALLSARCVRLAVLARLSNAMTGRGKLSVDTAQAVADLIEDPPPVPVQGTAGPGEVVALSWLVAPLADLPLGIGEAMALLNGSPFATAMACDVALTFRRRVTMAEQLLAMSIAASACPRQHFDLRLAQHWPDPYYGHALQRLAMSLGQPIGDQLNHQAPTSWRLIPNVLGGALQVLDEVTRAGEIGLQSLKDNPTFLGNDESPDDDLVVSSGGYHDHRAAKAIDQVNSVMVDLCVMAARHVARFLDGQGLGLPPLLAAPGDRIGMEFLAWTLTEPLTSARAAAAATTLDIGGHDPAGNQSDMTSLAFIAYAKHLVIARTFSDCMASLAITAGLALDLRGAAVPDPVGTFCEPFLHLARAGTDRVDAVSEPLRAARDLLEQTAADLSEDDFAHVAGLRHG